MSLLVCTSLCFIITSHLFPISENTLILLMGVAKLAVIWVFNYLLLAAIFLAGISGKV